MDKYTYFAGQCTSNRVYPLSIAQRIQSGDIVCDDEIHTRAVLFWHYAGFAYLSGEITESFLQRIDQEYMQKEQERRFLLVTDDPIVIRFFSQKEDVQQNKRIEYRYDENNGHYMDACRYRIERISETNIRSIQGRIIPSFSWADERQFLENGFGYAAMDKDTAAAAAFSSAVSSEEVDIGIETREEYRHQNLAKVLAGTMCRKILALGKKPVWAHGASNTAAMRTAMSVGFVPVKENTVFRRPAANV